MKKGFEDWYSLNYKNNVSDLDLLTSEKIRKRFRVLREKNVFSSIKNSPKENGEFKLISGKEALIALANGEEVECKNDVTGMDWSDATGLLVRSFFDPTHMWGFRLKPRTITLNGIEVPATFEPKDGDKY